MFKVFASAALLVAGLASAAPAQADQWDFISNLDSRGVYYTDIFEMINTGKKICATIRNNPTKSSLDALFLSLTRVEGFAPTEGAIIVTAAARHMCPDIWPAVQRWRDSGE